MSKKVLSGFRISGWLLIAAILLSGCSRQKEKQPELSTVAELDQKIELATKEHQSHPDDQMARKNLIVLLLQQGGVLERQQKFEQAIANYRRVLQIEPDHLSARWFIGRTLYRQKRYQEAIVEIESLVNAHPEYSDNIYDILADCYLQVGEQEKAKKAIYKSIALNPANRSAYRTLAKIRRGEGQLEEAAQDELKADDLEKWGYPERGYKEKSLDEWLAEAKPRHEGGQEIIHGNTLMSEELDPTLLEPEPGHGPGKGKGIKRRALAMYNVATYLDREKNPDDFFECVKAIQTWKKYLFLSKGLDYEESYRKLIKDRVKTIKNEKKSVVRRFGLKPVEEGLGDCQTMIQRFKTLEIILAKTEIIARDSGDEALVQEVAALKARYDQIGAAPYKKRLKAIVEKISDTIKRKTAGDPEMTQEMVEQNGKQYREEIQVLREELLAKEIIKLDEDIIALGKKLNISVPKHGDSEESDAE